MSDRMLASLPITDHLAPGSGLNNPLGSHN
jgi:hypothetical protein